jgi:methionyl-tRNA formyltransferase
MAGKIAFFLMNKKGYVVLSRLIKVGKDISQVVCARDKNLIDDYYEEIKRLCESNNIIFFDKKDYDSSLITANHIITIGWRWLITGKLQDKLIVSHDSILPKYRGFAPLVNMLINGESNIGVTFLYASSKYDRGDIIVQKSRKIDYPIKIVNALNIIAELFFNSILEIYEQLDKNEKLNSFPQDESLASYSIWRNEDDYLINFNKYSKDIKRFIDAVGYPYFGASAYIEDRKVRILDVNLISDVCVENRDVGKVIFVENSRPIIICGRGLLQINEMIYDDNKTSAIPLKSFRIKFKGKVK